MQSYKCFAVFLFFELFMNTKALFMQKILMRKLLENPYWMEIGNGTGRLDCVSQGILQGTLCCYGNCLDGTNSAFSVLQKVQTSQKDIKLHFVANFEPIHGYQNLWQSKSINTCHAVRVKTQAARQKS